MKLYQSLPAILAACTLFLAGCDTASSRSIKRMQALEEGVSSPTTQAEIQDAIKKYEKRVEDIVLAQEQVGLWYKMLGSRYIDDAVVNKDAKMYGEALKAFQKAVEYYPANPNLYYWVGVSAGYVAKASLDFSASGSAIEKYNYLKLSESAYLRAIELQPQYPRALYGLGVLYLFELDEPEKAVPYMETYVATQKSDTDGKFLLARAYYSTYEFQKAVDLYDDIIKTSKSDQKRREAENNKKLALDALYAES